MKTIELSENTQFPTKAVLKEVLEQAGMQGIVVGEMRKRLKILDKLEAANGKLELENSEWELLQGAYNRNQFRLAHKDLIAIAEAIDNAE